MGGYAESIFGLKTETSSSLKDLLLVLAGSILIALFAPISIKLPFTPVPIAMQPHVVLFLGALLGTRLGFLAVLTYLFQGAIGLPVFAGGTGGILCFLGPRGGYLVGYLLAVAVTGFLVESAKERTAGRAFLAMSAGNLAIYLLGLPWLSLFVGWKAVFLLGMAPFLVGDLLKLMLATYGLKRFALRNSSDE